MHLLLTLALALLGTPSHAKAKAIPLTQENLSLLCAGTFGTLLQSAHQEKDKILTPIFDEETDAKLLKLHSDIATGDAKAIAEFRKVATPIYQEKLKDEMATCFTLMKIKQEVCGDNFITEDCDPEFTKRADGKALFASYTSQLRARFMRPKPAETQALNEIATPSGTSQTLMKSYFFIGCFWLLLIAFFAFKFLRPAKKCPSCNHSLPKFRMPTDMHEVFAGGWTCQNCGTKLTYGLKKRF